MSGSVISSSTRLNMANTNPHASRIPVTPSPKRALMSRATADSPKRIRGFLGLPGEIRNQMYDYYFQRGFRVEIAAKGESFGRRNEKVMTLCLGIVNPDVVYKYKSNKPTDGWWPATLRMSRRLGRYQRVHGVDTLWEGSLCALILVCKQVYAEAAPFLYQSTTFAYNAPRRLLGFLSVISNVNLAAITRLDLHYSTYGGPRYRKDVIFQEKHLATWTSACKAASKKLEGLQKLQVWLRVNYAPLWFDLRQPWVQPLIQFRRLTCARKATIGDVGGASPAQGECSEPQLYGVKIHFATPWSGYNVFDGNIRLEEASMELHDLFGKAISKAILGSSEEEAMAGFKQAWEGKHAVWQHHLNFHYIGW